MMKLLDIPPTKVPLQALSQTAACEGNDYNIDQSRLIALPGTMSLQ